MTYNADLTWALLANIAGTTAETLKNALLHGKDQYDEWQSFRAGRDNATIGVALGRTVVEVAEMDACYAAFKELHDCANNVIVTQQDRYFSMRKFS